MQVLLAKLDTDVVHTALHVLVDIFGEFLDRCVTALLETENVCEEAQRFITEIVADILEVLIWTKEAPRHQWRELLRDYIEMCHESIGDLEHTLLSF